MDVTERLLAEILRLRREVDTLRELLEAKGILRPEEWPVATVQAMDESGVRNLVGVEDDYRDPEPATTSDTGSGSWPQAPPPAFGSSEAARPHQPTPASPPGEATRMPDRENTARAHLRRTLDREGLRDVEFDLARDAEGYRILLRRGAARWRRSGIDEAALEEEDSSRLAALIRQARERLNG